MDIDFSDYTGNLDRAPSYEGVTVLFGWNTGDFDSEKKKEKGECLSPFALASDGVFLGT
jgi:hypothetical protein